MKDQAIAKINAEMRKNANDPYTEIIGHYVIDRCLDEACAKKVMDSKKDLRGAMGKVMERAEQAKKGNVAVLMPADVFGAVDQYFGFTTDAAAQMSAMATAAGTTVEQPKPKQEECSSGTILNLEDFL